MTRDDIMAVQRLLRALGRDVAVDGLWGGESRQATSEATKAAQAASGPDVPVVSAQPLAARSIDEIIFHCTATPEGRDVTAADVRAWHRAQGWSDIGYHYLVRLDGTIEMGRPEAKIGAHVIGHNTGTLGVVYAGGVDVDWQPKDTRTAAQKAALILVRDALRAKYPAIKKVSGHRDYAAKDCPSFNVHADPLGKLTVPTPAA